MTISKASYLPGILSMVSGSISTLASLTVIIMIRRSNLKLSTIYRRLIFGLSISDLIQSFSQVLLLASTGNDLSCDMVGFAATLGVCCSVLYSISLSIYFLCVVKFEMEESKIKKYIEPFLHGVPIVYSLVSNIYIVSNNYFNPLGLFCNIAPPNGEDGEIDDEGDMQHAVLLRWIGYGGPIFIGFIFNCIILAMIWCTVNTQSKQMSQYYSRTSLSSGRNNNIPIGAGVAEAEAKTETETDGPRLSLSSSLKRFFQTRSRSEAEEDAQGQGQGQHQNEVNRSSHRNSNNNMSPLVARLSRPSRGMIQILKETSNRATAFIIGYIMTYIFSAIYRILETYSGYTPFGIIILARFFLPLQGFFNMIVYGYPHALSYRYRHNGISWIRAFWEVIKSGGDSDQIQPERRRMPKARNKRRGTAGASSKNNQRRVSLRNEPIVVDVSDSIIFSDVERIRSNYSQKLLLDSNDEESQNVEEVEQEDVDSGNIMTDLDSGDHFVGDREQISSLYCSNIHEALTGEKNCNNNREQLRQYQY